jgi:hypothetical protein
LATPPKDPPKEKAPSLPKEEIVEAITPWPWMSKEVKEYGTSTLWRTQYGFYFSVPHDCSQADLNDILTDLRKYGRKPNV